MSTKVNMRFSYVRIVIYYRSFTVGVTRLRFPELKRRRAFSFQFH